MTNLRAKLIDFDLHRLFVALVKMLDLINDHGWEFCGNQLDPC